MKLNLGSHNKKLEGFKNVDVQPLPNVDVVHDLTKFPYPFDYESVDEIIMQEFLEHVSFRHTIPILVECYRILKLGGKLTIQVPDIDAMCRMVDLQCPCVPRKAESYDGYKADPGCFQCGGKALIHPERWHVAFTGAQKHAWDAHLNHFTPTIMENCLERAGFIDFQRKPNIYKLIYEATKG